MRLLLDTHTLLWWVQGDRRLSPTASTLLLDQSNQVYLSSITAFEMETKVAAGKLRLPLPVEPLMAPVFAAGVVPLPVSGLLVAKVPAPTRSV